MHHIHHLATHRSGSSTHLPCSTLHEHNKGLKYSQQRASTRSNFTVGSESIHTPLFLLYYAGVGAKQLNLLVKNVIISKFLWRIKKWHIKNYWKIILLLKYFLLHKLRQNRLKFCSIVAFCVQFSFEYKIFSSLHWWNVCSQETKYEPVFFSLVTVY